MKKYLWGGYSFLLLGFMPVLLLAADDVLGLITTAKTILTAVLPLIMTLAVVYFLWSTAQFIIAEGEKKNEAREHMVWGIIILFVMVSVWGLVAILDATIFGTTPTEPPPVYYI